MGTSEDDFDHLHPEELAPFPEPILEAVRSGTVADVTAVLDADAQAIHHLSDDHQGPYDPLSLAIVLARLDVAALLLERGADPNASVGSDSTPVSFAIGLPRMPA